MNRSTIKKIKDLIGEEIIRRLLVDFFVKREMKYDITLYPPMIKDIAEAVPMLSDKIEVVPFSENIDPSNRIVKVGWNLFVLGVNRMYLGSSTHRSLSDMVHPGGNVEGSGRVTPRDVVNFIASILSNSENGSVDFNQRANDAILPPPTSGVNRPRLGPSASGSFYEKNKPA